MNDQFIQGVIFDWNKIDDDSYLKQIEALKNIERLEFKKFNQFLRWRKWKWKVHLIRSNCHSSWI